MATWTPKEMESTGYKEAELPNRQIYFHIKGKPEIRLVEGRDKIWAKKHLSRISDEQLVFYKPECLRKSQIKPEKSISKGMSDDVDENLSFLLSVVGREPSIKGILFQARFGSLYFLLPCRCKKILSTDELLQRSCRKEFLFGIPFNPQYFIQGDYLEDDGSDKSEYYKVYFTMEGVGAASRIDKQEDGTFKHVWTRAKTRESKSSSWHEKTKLDIVCIGRLVDIRMASILDRPCCSETENAVFCQTAEKIAKSMEISRSAADQLSGLNISMQIVGDNYYVYCVRKKSSKTYIWKENPEWKIVHCQTNTSVNISEDKCKEMRRNKRPYNDTVILNCNAREEIYFNGTNHSTQTTVDPDTGARTATTAHHFLSNFKTFVSASFDVAEMLDDTCKKFNAGVH